MKVAKTTIATATKADSHLQRVAQHGHDQYKPLQGAHISPPEVKSIVFELCKRILGTPHWSVYHGRSYPAQEEALAVREVADRRGHWYCSGMRKMNYRR